MPALLYAFPKSESYLATPPFLGLDGAFYGLILRNHTADAGIFRLTYQGEFSWVAPHFATGRVNYGIALMQARSGNFYGTLPAGGRAGAGSLYEVTPAGQLKTLYEFSDSNQGTPETLAEASDGMLYGTARGKFATGFDGYSSIFRLNPSTWEFQTIYRFQNGGVTGECGCSIIQGSDGRLYGTAANGGTYQLGTLFAYDAGLPPPKPRIATFRPVTGAVGRKVLLWGHNLLGTTAVDFNGVGTQFEVASGQAVWAWVPKRARTGRITITTPKGVFTMNQDFTVQ